MRSNAPEFEHVEKLAEHLFRCVVPIFSRGRIGKPESHGTAFLVEDSVHSFLISAAHVFDRLKSKDDLFFYVGPKHVRKIAGSLRITVSPDGKDRSADRLDVGVLKLEGDALPPYGEIGKRAIPMADLMELALPREGEKYLVTGFPGSKSRLHLVRKQVESAPFANLMTAASPMEYARLGCERTSYIVMHFNQRKVFGKDGAQQAFPSPTGMSGSPVWLLHDGISDGNPRQTSVVGVFTEYHRYEKLAVATDVGVALDLIRKARKADYPKA